MFSMLCCARLISARVWWSITFPASRGMLWSHALFMFPINFVLRLMILEIVLFTQVPLCSSCLHAWTIHSLLSRKTFFINFIFLIYPCLYFCSVDFQVPLWVLIALSAFVSSLYSTWHWWMCAQLLGENQISNFLIRCVHISSVYNLVYFLLGHLPKFSFYFDCLWK